MAPISATRIVLTYVTLGPLVGGAVVLAGIALTGPPTPITQWPSVIGFVLLFAFPFGLPQAIAVGIAHFIVIRFARFSKATLVCSCVVTAMVASTAFACALEGLGRVFSSLGDAAALLAPPAVAAIAVALHLSRNRLEVGAPAAGSDIPPRSIPQDGT